MQEVGGMLSLRTEVGEGRGKGWRKGGKKKRKKEGTHEIGEG